MTNKEGAIAMWEKYRKRGGEDQSGKGSTFDSTKHIIEHLHIILKQFNIKSISDAPCGSYHWMHKIDLTGIEYIGYDINKGVLDFNKKNYPNVTFKEFDIVNQVLPKSDLIICRDCLFHLSFKFGIKTLTNFNKSKSKYLLATNHPNVDKNNDLTEKQLENEYGWRKINLMKFPYHKCDKPLYRFEEPEWDREMCLWKITK